MQCPNCQVAFHTKAEDWQRASCWGRKAGVSKYISLLTICPACNDPIVLLHTETVSNNVARVTEGKVIYPDSSTVVNISTDVPESLRADFIEASKVLSVSPKASAALSRRILQSILREQGYTNRDLAKQVDAVLSETDSSKLLPLYIRNNIDAIRNFGNFSAHQQEDNITSEIIDVEPEEAEWCVQIVSDLFDHYYIRPAADRKKLDELNQKLANAGKRPVK